MSNLECFHFLGGNSCLSLCSLLVSNLENPLHSKLGLPECLNHGLLRVNPVLQEGAREYVAQFKFTALVGEVDSQGGSRLTEPFFIPRASSNYSFMQNDEIRSLFIK